MEIEKEKKGRLQEEVTVSDCRVDPSTEDGAWVAKAGPPADALDFIGLDWSVEGPVFYLSTVSGTSYIVLHELPWTVASLEALVMSHCEHQQLSDRSLDLFNSHVSQVIFDGILPDAGMHPARVHSSSQMPKTPRSL